MQEITVSTTNAPELNRTRDTTSSSMAWTDAACKSLIAGLITAALMTTDFLGIRSSHSRTWSDFLGLWVGFALGTLISLCLAKACTGIRARWIANRRS